MKKAYVIGTSSEGYAATLALLSRGFSVTLIGNESHTNQHRIVIEPETIKAFYGLTKLSLFDVNLDVSTPFMLTLEKPNQSQLDSMTDEDKLDFEFFNELAKCRCVIAIHKIQEYQERKLRHIMDNGGYDYYYYDAIPVPKRVKFQKDQTLSIHKNSYRVFSIDGEKQEITLLKHSTNEKISENFDVLVDATGAQHEISSMIGNSNNKFKVDYVPLKKLRHNAFGTIKLKVANPTPALENNPICAPLVGATLLRMRDLPILKKLGWVQDYLPFCLFHYTAESQEIYFTSEVPKHFLDCDNETKKQELLTDWATAIINIAYCRDRSLRSLEKNKKHNDTLLLSTTSLCSVHSQSLKYANKNAIKLPKGGVFFIIGSAFLQQNPLQGYDLKSVLDDANAIYTCFDEHSKFNSPYSIVQREKECVKRYENREKNLKWLLKKEQEMDSGRLPLFKKTAFVIGMGPGGYAAALVLLTQGFSVTLVDKRNSKTLYTRRHGIFMKQQTIMQFFALTKLVTFGINLHFTDEFTLTLTHPSQEQFDLMSDEDRLDFEFFKEVERSRSVVAIHKIQQYQEQKLRCIMDNGGYKIYSDNDATVIKKYEFSKKQKLSIHKGEYQVHDVNVEKQEITLLKHKTNEEVYFYFDVLVDATGARHEITSMIGKNDEEFKVDYTPLDSPRHNAFGVVILGVANPTSALVDNNIATPIAGKKLLKPKDLPILKKLGWDHDYLPLSFLKYTADQKEIYFAGEVPKHFLECKDNNIKQKLLEEWAGTIVSLGYGKAKDLQNLDDVKALSNIFSFSVKSLCSVFSQSPKYANTNSIYLPEGGLFFIIGDAFLPANFLFGHGLESVLSDVEALNLCFDDERGFDEGFIPNTSVMLEQKSKRIEAYKRLDKNLKLFLESKQQERSNQTSPRGGPQSFFKDSQEERRTPPQNLRAGEGKEDKSEVTTLNNDM